MSAPRRPIHLVEPPRTVPLKAQLAAIFGGAVAHVAWGLVLFGSLFVPLFAFDSEAVTLIEFRGALDTTQGEVLGVQETSASENKRRIQRVRFRYEVASTWREADSYATSTPLKAGDRVRVEYVVARPERARIEGLRAHTFSVGAAFVVLFPLVGLGLGIAQLPAGVRRRRLLRMGRLGYAKLVEKSDTGTRVNKKPVFELTFELTVPRERGLFGYREAAAAESDVHRIKHKTAELVALEDDAEEPFLYDPALPRCACPLDTLPGRVTIGHDGQIDASRTRITAFVLPILAVIVWTILVLVAAS